MNRENRAVVLLSGGLDSTTVTAIVHSSGMEICALSFSYGQKHTAELEMAGRTAEKYLISEHLIVDIDPEPFRGSSLTGTGRIPREGITAEIPSTYIPARNTVFLSMALGVAETRDAEFIFTGVNAIDYSGYPDCRPEYIDAFQKLADLATRSSVEGRPIRILAPLMHMTKAEIIRKGLDLGVDYSHTLSCYSPDLNGRSCGLCDACRLRLEGFRKNGTKDPAPYV